MSELTAIALHDYASGEEDEIDLVKGEQVAVIETYDDGWWLVLTDSGSTGLVPSNYLKTTVDDDSNGSNDLSRLIVDTPAEEMKTQLPSKITGSDMDQLSAVILERISEQLAARESRLFEEVKRMIGQSTLPLIQLSSKLSEAEFVQNQLRSQTEELPHQNRSSRSLLGDASRSKLPVRVSLPKLPAIQPRGVADRSSIVVAENKIAPIRNQAVVSETKLPVLISRNRKSRDALKEPVAIKDDASAAESPNADSRAASADGIQYTHCRSKVHAPSYIGASPPSAPEAELCLDHIYGYDGDCNRHGNAIRGKNVRWLSLSQVVYPAAAVIVVQDINDRCQGFFCGHSEDVTCLAVHRSSSATVVASGQLGKDCCIIVWDANQIEKGCSTSKCISKILPIPGTRGISGVDFSGDGKFLLAIGIDESHSIMIFNWKEGVMVAHSKVGHQDVSEAVFNPYLYVPVEPFCGVTAAALAAGMINNKGQKEPFANAATENGAGCYTLISFGKKNAKFWTLREYYVEEPNSLEEISSFRGRKLSVRKDAGDFKLKFLLEGTLIPTSSKSSSTPDITSFFISQERHTSHSSAADQSQQESKVFFGTGDGSIYIWQQIEDKRPLVEKEAPERERRSGWLPRGRLLSVVTELHDGPIVSMDYLPFHEKVISSSSDGVVNMWNIVPAVKKQSIPFEHVGSFELDNEFARSVCWNPDGKFATLGTACNSVLLLTYKDTDSSAEDKNDEDADRDSLFRIDVLNQSHDGKVRRLADNPILSSVLVSISSDKTVRFWDWTNHVQLCYFQLTEPATAVAFSADGKALATGNEHGELSVFSSSELDQVVDETIANNSRDSSLDLLYSANWKQIVRKNISVKPDGADGSKRKASSRKCEVTEIKFCPSGDSVAIGSKDKLIHILSTSGYKHLAVCRGHSSYIRNIDFSSDGLMIQSTDFGKELLHWDARTGQRLTHASAFRDALWHTITCIYGWGVMGVFNSDARDGHRSAIEGEINCVCRSPDGKWLVAGGSHTVHRAVKLFNFPCLSDATPSHHGGHTSPVLDVIFLVAKNGQLEVASAGGNDSCLFQWKLCSS